MKTLNEVIDELEDEGLFADALHYLKEYKAQKRILKKLHEIFSEMFYWVGEGFPLDAKELENKFFDAYREGFDDEDAG